MGLPGKLEVGVFILARESDAIELPTDVSIDGGIIDEVDLKSRKIIRDSLNCFYAPGCTTEATTTDLVRPIGPTENLSWPNGRGCFQSTRSLRKHGQLKKPFNGRATVEVVKWGRLFN